MNNEYKYILSLLDDDIKFDFNKVRGRIKEVYGTQTSFAVAMLMNESTLSNKLNNNVEFSPKEILRACALLSINENEIQEYFFKFKVQKTEKQTCISVWKGKKNEDKIWWRFRKTKRAIELKNKADSIIMSQFKFRGVKSEET